MFYERTEDITEMDSGEVAKLLEKAKEGTLDDSDRVRLLKGACNLLLDEVKRAYSGLVDHADHKRLELAELLVRISEEDPN